MKTTLIKRNLCFIASIFIAIFCTASVFAHTTSPPLDEKQLNQLLNTRIHVTLPTAYVYGTYKFKNEKERVKYTNIVHDVRRTYPFARMIASAIIESYEMMETFSDDEQKQKHLESVKNHMKEVYGSKIKKLSSRQGKILIKLIDRECGQSSFHIVKAVLGSGQAHFYNAIAGVFGNSLKAR